jgi:TRAP-type mannitol/chloroaromatic compound transport system permease small subunit
MARLKAILRFIDNTSEWSGRVVCYFIVFAMFILLYEIVVRYIFNSPTQWAHEISRHFYGAHFILGAAYAFYHGMHVRTDVIVRYLSPRGQAIVDVIISLVFFYYIGLLLWKGGEMAWTSVLRQETSLTVFRSPLWPVKVTIPIGAFLLFMQGIAKFIRDIHHTVTGEPLA